MLLKNTITLFTALTLCFAFVLPAFAQGELTAQEIIKRSDDLMRGDTLRGKYQMTVETPDWKRTLELDAYSIGREKTFIRILNPPKEKGITTLRIKNNMWNYLPKVERTIKIPPSMMLQPWMGSDFTNDDLVKESSVVHDYTHKIVNEEMAGPELIYVIQLDPKPEAAVTWGKLIFRVRHSDFVPLREEFYSEHGKLIKVLEYSEVKQMSDREIPTVWKMTSMTKKSHVTIIKVDDVVYNEPVADSIFTMANLKSPR
jgi:outer membrane lipoprotein-sorting protein